MTGARRAWAAGGAAPALLLLAGFGAWAVVLAAVAEGFLEADEAGHYLYARHAPEHPMNLLHVWARPLFTLLLVPLSQLGPSAARLLSAASAIAAAGFAWRSCRALGWRRTAACAVPLTFVQPLFFQQTFGIWTEVVFSAFLGGWMLALVARRPRLCAGIAAALPLIRPEGVVVAAAVGIAALAGGLRDRDGHPVRRAPVLILPAGVILWALVAFSATGDPLWIPHHWPSDWLPRAAYGRGSWTWLVDAMAAVVPSVLAPLLVAGCFAPGMRRAWAVPFVAAAVLGVHATLWHLGAFGTAGYARYFVTLAPVFAVLVTGGVELLARALRPVPAWTWALAAAATAFFLLARHPTATHPPPLPPDARLFAALGRWIRERDPAPVLHSAHPFAYLEIDAVPRERFDDFGTILRDTLRAAPPGAWVLVEDRFYGSTRSSRRPEPASWGNPDASELLTLGFARVEVPDLGVALGTSDTRHDRAIEEMQWALFRKGGR